MDRSGVREFVRIGRSELRGDTAWCTSLTKHEKPVHTVVVRASSRRGTSAALDGPVAAVIAAVRESVKGTQVLPLTVEDVASGLGCADASRATICSSVAHLVPDVPVQTETLRSDRIRYWEMSTLAVAAAIVSLTGDFSPTLFP
ncbi:MAG: hypothetical protein ACHREM_20190 [Polyangiales bacterium]